MKNILILAGVGLLVILSVIVFYPKDSDENSNNQENAINKLQETKKPPINNTTPPPIPFFEDDEESVESILIGILADKHNAPTKEISINITQQEGDYVRGGVEFAPGGQGNAGMFLATKEKGQWEIVFDGNGNPDCVDLKQNYNFPESILTGFCD